VLRLAPLYCGICILARKTTSFIQSENIIVLFKVFSQTYFRASVADPYVVTVAYTGWCSIAHTSNTDKSCLILKNFEGRMIGESIPGQRRPRRF